MRLRHHLGAALAALVLAGCGGGGAATGPGDDGGNPPGGGPTFSQLSMSPTSGSVEVGGTFQLTATPQDAGGNAMNGAPAPTYESANTARATVSPGGLVTGVAAGAVTIRAFLTHQGKTDTATAEITVIPGGPVAAFTSLTVEPDFGSVAVGGTLPLTATPRDQNGQAMTGLPAATWSSGDAARATISGGVVTGRAAGTVTITASLTAGGVTRSASASITVTETVPSTATVQGVEDAFTPQTVTIAEGGTVTWTMVDEEHDVTWDGPAPEGGNIPRIDDDEQVSRRFAQAGTYAYHCERHDAEHGGTVIVKTAQAENPVFTSLSVSPNAVTLAPGATRQLTATPRDQAGAPMAGLPAATWSSSDQTKATVSASGLVTAVAVGTARITATLTQGGTTRTAEATVTVSTAPPPPPPPPTGATVGISGARFSPASVTIGAGAQVTWTFGGGDRHNVTFSGAAPVGGNIPDTESGSVSRTFPTAGTYNYSCTRHNGMTGQVIVNN